MGKSKLNYQELLRNPLWIAKRNQILSRDNNTCQFCGRQDRYMHVHHKRYEKGKMPWEYNDDDLVCICGKCHKEVTNDKDFLYLSFLQVRDLFRDFGFSDSVFETLLGHISSVFECYFDGITFEDKNVLALINDAVCASQKYDDFKVLAKFGIKHSAFVRNTFPMFADEYDSFSK